MSWLLSVPATYRWAATLVFIGFIAALSIGPGISRPGDSLFAWLVVNTATPVQKVMHVAVYALLMFLWVWTLESIDSRMTRIALALSLTIGLGIVLEWYQTTVPGRFGTIFDVLLNGIGALIGLLAAVLLL